MSDENRTSSQQFEGTRVDLGDDLLEGGTLVSSVRADLSSDASPDDLFENAKILLNESLVEESKKLLHRVLIRDPHHLPARRLLDEIHDNELRQLFGADTPVRKAFGTKSSAVEGFSIAGIDSEAILRDLDRDLNLGVLGQLSLFESDAALEEFAEKIDRDLQATTPQDRIDLGVGFLEMDQFLLASRQFQAAYEQLCLSPASSESSAAHDAALLSATSLLAYSLILSGRSFEAASCIQPALRDPGILKEDKLELIYLMGRAYEALKDNELAAQWYLQTQEIEPGYRDVEERLRRLSLR